MATHDHTGNADEITPQARTLTREENQKDDRRDPERGTARMVLHIFLPRHAS
jgi:hypothetical protein